MALKPALINALADLVEVQLASKGKQSAAALRARANVASAREKDMATQAKAQQAQGQPEQQLGLQTPIPVNAQQADPSRGSASIFDFGSTPNQIANNAVVGARQQAGTAGVGQPSVTVGGQTFSAPNQIQTVQEGVRQEVVPGDPRTGVLGVQIPSRFRQVTTQPNVLTPADILNLKADQERFAQKMTFDREVFQSNLALSTNQAKATVMESIMESTGANAGQAAMAATAITSGNIQEAVGILGDLDTVGRAQIASQRAMASFNDAQARLLRSLTGDEGTPSFESMIPGFYGKKSLPSRTPSELKEFIERMDSDAQNALKENLPTEMAATQITQAAVRAVQAGQGIMVGVKTPGLFGLDFKLAGASFGLTRLPATVVFSLMHAANEGVDMGDDAASQALRDKARATLAAMNLDPNSADDRLKLWAKMTGQAYKNVPEFLLDQMVGRVIQDGQLRPFGIDEYGRIIAQ